MPAAAPTAATPSVTPAHGLPETVPAIPLKERVLREAPVTRAARWARAAPLTSEGAIDVVGLARAMGWEVRIERLGAAVGGMEACLVPSEKTEFTIVVDPDPAPDEDWEVPNNLVRFRVAHELGHTPFYRPGRPPHRRQQPDLVEEAVCDRFAAALLVPPDAAARAVSEGPAAAVRLARSARAPVACVLDSAAERGATQAALGGTCRWSRGLDSLELKIQLIRGLAGSPWHWEGQATVHRAIAANLAERLPATGLTGSAAFLVLGDPEASPTAHLFVRGPHGSQLSRVAHRDRGTAGARA